MYGAPRRPSLREDHRGPDDLLLLAIDENEHVLALGGLLDGAGKRAKAEIDDLFDAALIGRQVHRIEMRRNVEELGLVSREKRAYLEPAHRPEA